MKGFNEFKFKNKEYLNSEKISKGIFSLPLYPEIKNKQIFTVCVKLKKILKELST